MTKTDRNKLRRKGERLIRLAGELDFQAGALSGLTLESDVGDLFSLARKVDQIGQRALRLGGS